MSEANQYIEEAGDIAPKPSAVRRSGRINYARMNRTGRPGLNQPSIRRLTEQQTQRSPLKTQLSPSEPQPEPQPEVQPEPQPEPQPEVQPEPQPEVQLNHVAVDDSLAKDTEGKTEENSESIVYETADAEDKLLETPDDPQAILGEKMSGLEASPENNHTPAIVEDNATSGFMSTFEDIQDEIEGQGQGETNNDKSSDITRGLGAFPSVSEEPEDPASKVAIVPSQSSPRQKARARVYHRPHTNQTVSVCSSNIDDNDNDSKSTASGLSQPSWAGRRKKRVEEEDGEEISQTSMGNSKRRARIARRKKRNAKSADSGNFGYVVSQAFDKMLGYAGGQDHEAEDGYSSDESAENILKDFQEAILTTLGCVVPQNAKPMKRKNIGDDKSDQSSVRHVRDGSNLSGSVFSVVSGSGVGSVLSFDTTEELADFSKQKRVQSAGSYKVPDNYDPNPPKILQQKTAEEEDGPVYSEDLYSDVLERDFEPVDLLSEGDSLLDSVGKDLMSVASTKVDEVFTSIQGLFDDQPLIESIETNGEGNSSKTTNSTSESTTVVTALSNVTEPLEIITETDVEGSPLIRKSTEKTNDIEFGTFTDRFEINVFETDESGKEAEVVKTDNPLGSSDSTPSFDRGIDEAASAASLFQGIDDQESLLEDPPLCDDVEDLNFPLKVLETTLTRKEEPSSPSIENKCTDTTATTATASEKTATDAITVDRDVQNLHVISEEQTKDDLTPTLPPSAEPQKVNVYESFKEGTELKPLMAQNPEVKAKKQNKTSFQAAVEAPETKKPKKFGGFKGLIRRSFKKNKKGSKSSAEEPTATLSGLTLEDNTLPQAAPAEKIKPTPSKEISAGSTEPTSISTPEEGSGIDEKPVDAEEAVTREQPDPPAKDHDKEYNATKAPLSCPTTPVREPEGAMDTPKMSNLRLEERKLTRPMSGANLADLPGIDEANSFREDPPASQDGVTNAEVVPTATLDTPSYVPSRTNVTINDRNSDDTKCNDGFDLSFDTSRGFAKTQITSIPTETTTSAVSVKSFDEDEKEVSFDSFNLNLDLTAEHSWESFGDNDRGAAAYRQKAIEDSNGSPQKVSAFPV